MRLPSFEYYEPTTVKEACSLLAKHGKEAKVIAGGTDLLVLMKQRVCRPQHVVSIKGIKELDFLDFSERGGLRIGPLVTLSALAEHPRVQKRFTALSQAAASVASPNIRNLATLGGNLCLDARCWYYNQPFLFQQGRDPCFKRGGDQCYHVKGGKFCYAQVSSDTVAALVALGASVHISSARGEREVAVAEFFTGKGDPANVLSPKEIVTEIRIPTPPRRTGSAFIKEAFRGSIDFGIANAAAVVSLGSRDGVCQDARIALTAVSPSAVDATKAAAALKGRRIDANLAAEAGEVAVREARPISSLWTPVHHRRQVIQALVKRATLKAAEQARA